MVLQSANVAAAGEVDVPDVAKVVLEVLKLVIELVAAELVDDELVIAELVDDELVDVLVVIQPGPAELVVLIDEEKDDADDVSIPLFPAMLVVNAEEVEEVVTIAGADVLVTNTVL